MNYQFKAVLIFGLIAWSESKCDSNPLPASLFFTLYLVCNCHVSNTSKEARNEETRNTRYYTRVFNKQGNTSREYRKGRHSKTNKRKLNGLDLKYTDN